MTVARALTARGIKPARDTLHSYQSARAEFREGHSFDERTPRCGGAALTPRGRPPGVDPGAYAAQGVCLLSNMLSTARIPFGPKPQWYLVTRSIFPSVDGRFGEGLLVRACTHKTGAGGMSALGAKRKGPIGKPR